MYIVFIQDEYNNNWLMGTYKELSQSIKDINSFLQVYNIEIDKIEEYSSTYGPCFDRELDTPDGETVMIRGFYIKDLKC